MHLLDSELRPFEGRLAGHQHAKEHRRPEQQVRTAPRGTGEIPPTGAHYAASFSGARADQLSLSVTAPVCETKRPARLRSSSQAGPAAPRRSAAFAATSAMRQLGAATVTSRHGLV